MKIKILELVLLAEVLLIGWLSLKVIAGITHYIYYNA